MASLQDLHFAAALAVVKAQTLSNLQSNQDADRGRVELLQVEVERLRQENDQLKQQIEAMDQAASPSMNLDFPDSIIINLKDPVMINTFKQVDIIRSYIERCRDRAFDSGTVFVDITCDVLLALSDSSLRQNKNDVVYAADWIGEGLDIAFNNNSNPPEDCVMRVSNALLLMMSTFRKTDCFSEPFMTVSNLWRQHNNPILLDVREQVMHFLIHLAKRPGLAEFIISGLCSELLVIINDTAEALNTDDHVRHSQNASYICSAIDLILQNQTNRPKLEADKDLSASDQLSKYSGLRKWVEIWPEILTLSVKVCDKLPLITTFMWRLSVCIEGGCGTAWRIGLHELKESIICG